LNRQFDRLSIIEGGFLFVVVDFCWAGVAAEFISAQPNKLSIGGGKLRSYVIEIGLTIGGCSCRVYLCPAELTMGGGKPRRSRATWQAPQLRDFIF